MALAVTSFTAITAATAAPPALEPVAAGAGPTIDAGIESNGTANAPYTISGTVREILSSAPTNEKISPTTPIENVKVYAMWREGNADRDQVFSPAYYSTTDKQGNFSIELKPYADYLGRIRYFDAISASDVASCNSRVGALEWQDACNEKIRLWAVLPDGAEKELRLVDHYAQLWAPTQSAADSTYKAEWTIKSHTVTDVVFNYVRNTGYTLHKAEDEWAQSGAGDNADGTGIGGYVSGRAFWNAGVPNGALDTNAAAIFNRSAITGQSPDVVIPNQKIVGSYLSDQAVTAIENYAKTNFAGHKLHSKDWTVEDEKALQAWIKTQIEKDPSWIAESVVTTTNANGEYELYFKGIYGNDYDSCGIVGKDKCHKLAESNDAGSFSNSNLNSKHINDEWMYVGPADLPAGVGVQSPWQFQRFMEGQGDGTWKGGYWVNGDEENEVDDYWRNLDILLSPGSILFDVLKYNTSTVPAHPGDTVQTYTSGILANQGLTYDIVWTDPAGKTVKEQKNLKVDNFSLPSVDFTVPEDLAENTVYTATLYISDGAGKVAVASDAFVALVSQLLPNASLGEAYKGADNPDTADVDETNVSVNIPDTDDESYGNYQAEGLPKGLTLNPDTGIISGVPEETGVFEVTVTHDITVKSTGAKVNQVRSYRIISTDTPLADGTVGKAYEQEVKPIGLPDDAKNLKLQSVTGLPKGLTYADGKITGTPTEITEASEEHPNVTVTYSATVDGKELTFTDLVPLAVLPSDDDGDGVSGTGTNTDVDENNDGEPDDPDAPALESQKLTHGVSLVDSQGKGVKGASPILSDGSSDKADAELQITYKDQKYDFSALNVTVNGKDANAEETDTVSAWRGSENLPVVRNFGLADFKAGEYAVTVKEAIDNWAVAKSSDLQDGGKLKITGNTPNQDVVLGFDTDNNGIADVDENDAGQYQPNQPAAKTGINTAAISTAPITFDDTFTADPEKLDPTAADSPLKGTSFALADDKGTKATIDANTGVITVPKGTAAGTYKFTIDITYPDKSTENVVATVTVTAPNDGDGDGVTDDKDKCAGTPAGAKVDADGCSVVPVVGDLPKIAGTVGEEIDPVEVSVTNDGNATISKCVISGVDGLTAAYDPAKGACVITGTPTAPDTDGYTVEVTYDRPDVPADKDTPITKTGETEITTPTPAAKDTDQNQPQWADLTVEAGKSASGAAPTDTIGKDGFPQGTEFKFVKNTQNQFGAWVEIDAATGVITASPKADQQLGEYSLRIDVIYPDKTADTVNAKVIVTAPSATPTQAETYEPTYTPTAAEVGKSAASAAPTFDTEATVAVEKAAAPEGTGFALGDNAPADAAIDPATGVVTLTPSADQAGKTISVPVVVTYKDGSTDNTDAEFNVAALKDGDGDGVTDDKDKCADTPAGAKVDADGCSVVPVVGDLPKIAGTVGEEIDPVEVPVTNDGNATISKCVISGVDGLTAAYDPAKGACVITGTPTAPDTDGYTVEVTYDRPDVPADKDTPITKTGETEIVKLADPNPQYADTTVGAGKTVKVTPTNDGDAYPEGTVFAIAKDFETPAGYTVEIDPATGELSISANPAGENGADVEVFDIPVVVTYGDSGAATDNVNAKIKLDTDNDGDPDVTDPDDDNDKVPDKDEDKDGTDPKNPDSDGDGLTDGTEKEIGTDPKNPDTDGDNLTDGEEKGTDIDENGNPVVDDKGEPVINDKGTTKTDPTNPDTDKDGVGDGSEVKGGEHNPFDKDEDGKGDSTDPLNPDTDGDGVKDGDELGTKVDENGKTVPDPDQQGEPITDPNNPDTDGDGLTDGEEIEGSQNPFKDNKYNPNGKPGNSNPLNPDTDGDGFNDYDEVTGNTVFGKATDPNKADQIAAPAAGKPAETMAKTGSAAAGVVLLAGVMTAIGIMLRHRKENA